MAVESIVSASFFPHTPFGKFLSPKCTRGKFKNSNACSCCAMLLKHQMFELESKLRVDRAVVV